MKPAKKIEKTLERLKLQRTDRLNLPFTKFMFLTQFMTEDSIKSFKNIPSPEKVCGVNVPGDLQLVTYGTLCTLQRAAVAGDEMRTVMNIVNALTDASDEAIMSEPAANVLGLLNMVESEMERIGKLFDTLQSSLTGDQMAAGADKLNFGTFGIVDYYAKRMGLKDHDEVFAVPWQRIWQCLKIDKENADYEQRYRQVIERKHKKR